MRARWIGILSLLFFLISFLTGLNSMYYKSPKLVFEDDVFLVRGNPKFLTLPAPVSTKIYYKISCTFSDPSNVSLSFLDKNSNMISSMNFSSKENAIEGCRTFPDEPARIMLNLDGGNKAFCNLKLYYSQFDEFLLFSMIIVQLISCVLAISLIFSWYVKLQSATK